MSDSGEPAHLSELPPAHNLILSVDGQSPQSTLMSHDLADKTVAELKEMGFEDVVQMDLR